MNTIAQAAPATAAEKQSWIAWGPTLALPATTIPFRDLMPAWAFMWSLSFAIFAGLKWMTWWQARSRVRHSAARSIAYLLAWPGMDAEAFLDRSPGAVRPRGKEWLWALSKTLLGAGLFWIVARRVPADEALVRGWIGLFGLIFLLHFGSFHLIALFWQAVGIDAQPIMAKPILSKSLAEFWGKRWNLGFRQLAHEFIFRPLQKRTGPALAGLCVFFASGVIHDLVISLPARGGYGLPTAYFLFQGFGVLFERSAFARRIGLQEEFASRALTIVVTAVPAFWLFHPLFVERVIVPFMQAVRAL